jgi:pimeloyl-ACP methyl ester carboxylesterase
MLNWYRAAVRYDISLPGHPRIIPPTLILWGKNDKFIGPEAAGLSRDLCERAELEMFDENTHWLQHEIPSAICQRVLRFAAGSNP